MKKQVKRTLMNGYVEFTDGTFGKYDATTDEFVPVHEDEASAFEEDLYFDDEDIEVTEEVAMWTEKSLF